MRSWCPRFSVRVPGLFLCEFLCECCLLPVVWVCGCSWYLHVVLMTYLSLLLFQRCVCWAFVPGSPSWALTPHSLQCGGWDLATRDYYPSTCHWPVDPQWQRGESKVSLFCVCVCTCASYMPRWAEPRRHVAIKSDSPLFWPPEWQLTLNYFFSNSYCVANII